MDNDKKDFQNPFCYLEPVKGEDFINREEIIDNISNITFGQKQQGNVWVVGERQVGKTSLLKKIESIYKDNANYPVITLYGTNERFKVLFKYVNCQLIRDETDFHQRLSQALINHFNFKIEIEEKENTFDVFINTLKMVHDKQYYIIFLLDEFDALIEKMKRKSLEDTSHFFEKLNVLKHEISELEDCKAFGLILAANLTFVELINNFELKIDGSGMNYLVNAELNDFRYPQVTDLIKLYLRDNPIQFSDKEIKYCFAMTKGYPLFTQKLLSIMYDEKMANFEEDKYTIDYKKIEKEYKKTLFAEIESWGKQK